MKPVRALALLPMTLPALAQYAGPAILSRGDAPVTMAGAQISFRPFATITGIYTTGLAGVTVANAQGELASAEAYGISLAGGISGAHNWRGTHLGLDYRCAISDYSKATFYDSVDQSLALGLSHQFTRHIQLTLREAGGMFSQGNPTVGLSSTVPFDPSTSYVPTATFYDNRTVYFTSQADLTIQKSARLSFDLGSDVFLTHYRSAALYGVNGQTARGDMQYRWSRTTTIGVNYTFTHYGYTRILSDTVLHGASLTYATRLSRYLELSGYAGFLREETKFIQNIPIDPAIASLLGIGQGTVLTHQIHYLPNLAGRLSRTFQHGVVYLSGAEGMTPGNGLFLASKMRTAMAGYGYTGLKRWSLNTSVSYNSAYSIGNFSGNYGVITGAFSMSHPIARSVSLVASYTAYQYRSTSFNNYNRLLYTASLGIGFAPGELPLRVW